MNATVTPIRTEAETAFLDMFEARRATLPGAGESRKAAIDRFARTGLPHRRVESWHYTDLRGVLRTAASLDRPHDAATSVPRDALTQGVRLVVLDGAFRADLSDLRQLPAGVSVMSVSDAPQLSLLASDTNRGAIADSDAVVSLNAALFSGGVVIDVAPGTQVEAPLVLVVALSGGGAQGAVTRSVVRVGEGASVSLVEDARSLADGPTQSNDALVVTLSKSAKLAHVARVRHGGPHSIHLHSLLLEQDEGSSFESFCLVADGGLVRRQIFAGVGGEEASLTLSGLSLLDRARLADATLIVDHRVPHGTSREFFRFILDGESTGVYQGKVIVRPHAQKTDGGMKSNALVLSEGASMNNKPELEIFADDVVCGHGATVGQLDADQLFYLTARGIPRSEAEGLLVEAFGAEAIERVRDEAMREALLDELRNWLANRAIGTRAS